MRSHILCCLIFIVTYLPDSTYCQPATGENAYSESPPELNWKFSLPAPVYSSPVISETHVYFGCLDNIFYALDLFTGELLWKFRTNGAIRSTAAVNNNRIYFTSGDGKLYCLDGSGKLIWSFAARFDKQYDFADYFQSSPVISGDAIFFGCGDGYIYAIHLSDGALKWEYKTGDIVHGRPAIDGNSLYAGSFDGYVYALSVMDGSLKWKFKTVGHRYFPKGEVQGDPAIAGDLVIVGARDYNVYALDAEKGYSHWNKAFTKGWVLSNTVHDSVLYMAGADERMLAAADLSNGRISWQKEMELLQFGHPAFDGNMMYAGTTIGKMHGIDLKTGEKKWTFTTDEYKSNHLKYFKEDDSYRDDIYSIIKSSEQFLEVEEELGGIFSSPALSNRNLVFTSTEGAVYCLKLEE